MAIHSSALLPALLVMLMFGPTVMVGCAKALPIERLLSARKAAVLIIQLGECQGKRSVFVGILCLVK
ncbi:MAG: hypothetical protein C5B50_17000 [Verrucomicrobia bacterium]|nr:MAG: hypothetical protein C5B50_17000 [Verrucomicrobiota bacterium]